MAKKYVLKRINKTGFKKPVIDEARFSINYQDELNTTQFDAASSVDGAYLVIAGAGTGKTRTLVYRVARLIEMGNDPKSILLLTFTRKAAREMMSRAALLLDSRCSKINGGTFHSFANLTLRRYAKAIGLDSAFTILDQGDSEDVINLIRGQQNVTHLKKRFPNKQTIFKVLSFSVNTSKSVDQILEDAVADAARTDVQLMRSGSERVRKDCAWDIMNRRGYKPKEHFEVEGALELKGAAGEHIKKALEDLQSIKKKKEDKDESSKK